MPATIIGVTVTYLGGTFLSSVLSGIDQITQSQGVQTLVIESSPESVTDLMLAHDHVAGWIVVVDSAGIEKLQRGAVPVVAISAPVPTGLCPVVLPDNRGGTQAMVEHLIAHGHQRIAFIGYSANADLRQRYEGYLAALAAHSIALDPELVIDATGLLEHDGQTGTRELLAAGRPFTALVTGTDYQALGAMQVLRDAGYRVPEDVAVGGFDDLPVSQFADPPLTTIRQRPDGLGMRAAQILLDAIAGRPAAQAESYVPTVLTLRQSCGCLEAQETIDSHLDDLHDQRWALGLAQELVALAQRPMPPDLSQPVEQSYPGLVRICEGLAQIIRGGETLDSKTFVESWREAVSLNNNLETLYAMLKVLEQAAERQIADLPDDNIARRRAAAWLDRARLAMIQARLDQEVTQNHRFEQLLFGSYTITTMLLQDSGSIISDLTWFDQVRAHWACLALWEMGSDTNAVALVVTGTYQQNGAALVQRGRRYPAASFPPAELLAASTAGDPAEVVILMLETAAQRWGALAISIPTAGRIPYELNNLSLLAKSLSVALEHQSLIQSLKDQQATLNRAYERERALADTVRAIGCPVIPLLAGVLLVPLVGAIDSSRAQQVIEAVLDGVNRHQADTVLLDITGVPLVDTQVASSLLQATRAAMLLGARAILVGVRPEIAQSIVGLGLDLTQIRTFPTLEAAITSLRRGR